MEFNHNQETVSCGAQMEAVRWMERHPEVFGPCSARDEVLAGKRTRGFLRSIKGCPRG